MYVRFVLHNCVQCRKRFFLAGAPSVSSDHSLVRQRQGENKQVRPAANCSRSCIAEVAAAVAPVEVVIVIGGL